MLGLGFLRDVAALLAEVEREGEQRGELGGEGLGAGHADFRPGVGGDDALRLARDGGADDVADGEGGRALGDHLKLGGDGVGGFAALGDEQAERAGDGVAVAVLAGVVDVDGQAGEPLDHELAREAAVPGGAAGGDGHAAGGLQVGLRDVEVGQEDLPAESSETRPRVVSRTARGCSLISLSMKCL